MTSVVAAAAAAWAPRFVDIGANLLDPMFQGIYNGSSKHPGDLDAVLDRARARGVEVWWALVAACQLLAGSPSSDVLDCPVPLLLLLCSPHTRCEAAGMHGCR